MAPSFDFAISLFCAEEAIGGVWEDEVGSQCDEENVAEPHAIPHPIFPVEDDEAIAGLIERETSHMPEEDYEGRFQRLELDAGSREHAVNWILKVQAHYNFGPLTTYLSVNYFDRFLSSHQLTQGRDWMLQLLCVSCISLAAKMEEPELPLPLDLQVGELKYVFEARTIQRMELLILSTLKWRISSVTPFSYIGHLLHKIGVFGPLPCGLVSRITGLILSTCRLVHFVSFRPSAIAIASVVCACEEFFPSQSASYREVIFSALPVSEETTLKCYQLMRDLLIDPFWTSKNAVSASLLVPPSPAGVLDAAACLSSDSDSTARSVGFSGSMQSTPTQTTRKRKFVELSITIAEQQR